VAAYLHSRLVRQGRVGVLPAAFNPPTIAHSALAEAAQSARRLDQVIFVLPQTLPHKEFEHANFEQRLSLLAKAVERRPDWAVATAEAGLASEIVAEIRALCGPDVEAFLLCGADAAERFAGWDYGEAPSFEEQMQGFQMVVAARSGEYDPPSAIAGRVHRIVLPPEAEAISSSAVRKRIAARQPWRDLVTPAVADEIERLGLYQV
jgi:nicotinate-nucleotide adenylyltransferase